MKIIKTLALPLLTIFVVYYIAWDNIQDFGQARKIECVFPSTGGFMDKDTSGFSTEIKEALLASRFNSLDELKSVIQIEYYNPPSSSNSKSSYSRVRLRHCSNGWEVSSELESGIDQDDIKKVRFGSLWKKAWLVAKSPFTAANRMDFIKIFSLARRRPNLFGAGDVAFYDLAETSVKNINTMELAFRHPRDSSEKGYINSFNHITAQAFITALFSEEMADLISDVHERKNMSELTIGRFTKEQLTDPDNNPMDNYVDIINNEWGQEIGKKLKNNYQIDRETHWTPTLLTNCLNDLQSYYSWAFQIGFTPYSIDDDLVIRYANKINLVMQGKLPM